MHTEFASDAARKPGPAWWLGVLVAALVLGVVPLVADIALQLSLSLIFISSLLALSMAFLWGYGGILSFGQTVFYGLGGYCYAVAALNFGTTGWALLLAIVLAAAFGLLLGYFMIYGRISEIYLSVITLVVTLIFEKAIRSTSGPEYVIGSVRLNGQNGIPAVPGLQLPWQDAALSIEGVFYLAAAMMLLAYVGLRLLLTTSFGRILVGIRENEVRIRLLGYDSRRYKLAAFALSAALAGLSGSLYAIWGNFVAPEMFNLNQAAQVVIWVIVGGRSTLVGPIVGTGAVQYLTTWLGASGVGQVSLVLGFVLMICVLAFREGLLVWTGDRLRGLARMRRPLAPSLGSRAPSPGDRDA